MMTHNCNGLAALVIFVAILSGISFPLSKQSFLLQRRNLAGTPTDGKHKETNNFFLAFCSAVTNVFKPIKLKMIKSNMVSGLKFESGSSSMRELRKKYKSASHWDKIDIVQNFAEKFLPKNYESSPKTAKLLQKMKSMQEEGDLLMSLDEYNVLLKASDMDPLSATEKFITDTLMMASSPLKSIDKTKLVKNRMFFKPVQMSRLRKVLADDPDYFEK